MMKIGIAADHGGFVLKEELTQSLRGAGYEVVDFGAYQLTPDDDYPDFIIPLARAVAAKEVERGVALCGSGIGASVAANKVAGVRAGLVHDVFSARQGVEDDAMNMFCLGGKVIGSALALELIRTFLAARFSNAARHRRGLAKVQVLETNELEPIPVPVQPDVETEPEMSPDTMKKIEVCSSTVSARELAKADDELLAPEWERLLLACPP